MTCPECQPKGMITGPRRIDVDHVGVRHGDHRNANIKVFLNDQDVTNDCIEAISGDDGTVIYYPRGEDGHFQRCECGDNGKIAVVTGKVEILNALR